MTGERAGVTGRVIFFRNTGKLCFATLREGDAELQVMLSTGSARSPRGLEVRRRPRRPRPGHRRGRDVAPR